MPIGCLTDDILGKAGLCERDNGLSEVRRFGECDEKDVALRSFKLFRHLAIRLSDAKLNCWTPVDIPCADVGGVNLGWRPVVAVKLKPEYSVNESGFGGLRAGVRFV